MGLFGKVLNKLKPPAELRDGVIGAAADAAYKKLRKEMETLVETRVIARTQKLEDRIDALGTNITDALASLRDEAKIRIDALTARLDEFVQPIVGEFECEPLDLDALAAIRADIEQLRTGIEALREGGERA